jgi:hypothetical protein
VRAVEPLYPLQEIFLFTVESLPVSLLLSISFISLVCLLRPAQAFNVQKAGLDMLTP